MKKSISTVVLFFVAVLIWSSQTHALFGGKVESFTADQVYTSPKGDVVQITKIYVTPDKVRMDGLAMGDQGQTLGVIYHKDEKRQCTFNPQKKLYFEGPLDEDKLKQDLKSVADMSEDSKVIGTEEVNGYKCTKKEVVTKVKIFGISSKSKSTVWISDKFDMPLKTLSEDGATMIMKNIKKGNPSSDLFKNPEGYKKVSSIMGVMGMDFSRMSRDDEEDAEDVVEDEVADEEDDNIKGAVTEKIKSGVKDKFKKFKGFFRKKKKE